jgi:hypothetical protein
VDNIDLDAEIRKIEALSRWITQVRGELRKLSELHGVTPTSGLDLDNLWEIASPQRRDSKESAAPSPPKSA